ncbi:ubiquitin carboxyl-terminal hydrolase 32-like [Saccoglossus kowalevskii]|uniref:ubiquitinyl hydrolase 1 n=1 Tax=Saccoglossus kowalevskii TaxID=10224 RepID=A0ABM0LTY4_SACKO|nr:PREDICTED: ubiquitin carboxyl-terminal hydrolase 32-like [Saccoglossus kowalevskii]
MGGKESKATVLPYEEAVKRVTDDELKRLKEAFKRTASMAGYMNKQMFVREVLGEGVPPKLADHIFQAFGGNTKGLAFKDLFCGLVLLTRGKREEKIKLVYSIYSNDSSGLVHKDELESLIMASDSHLPQSLPALFFDSDRATYEQFHQWVTVNFDATTITRWLLQDGGAMGIRLSDESDTPTFYQTLAGVTHLEEADIIELEKRYWQLKALSKTGRFDLETFIPMVSPPVPRNLCEGLFYAFDENRDNHIDFKEMACGLSACCRGPVVERQKFCFKIFDKDHDGLLSRKELEDMVAVLVQVRSENRPPKHVEADTLQDAEDNISSVVDDILASHDSDNDSAITLEEYQIWSVKSALPTEFLSLLFQICHIVLGLRTTTRHEEGDIIMGWVDRESRKGLQQGLTWYLISMVWWKSWKDYVFYKMTSSNQVISAQSKSKSLPRKTTSQTGQAWGTDRSLSQPSSPREANFSNNSTPSGSPKKAVNSFSQDVPPYGRSPAHTGKRNSQPSVTIPVVPQKPGPIDNTTLIMPETRKVMMLTNEGGRLRKNATLVRGRDFEILPEPVWKALLSWYGGSPALPRNVIIPSNGDPTPELELYPLSVRLLRHQANQPRQNTWNAVSMGIVGGFSFGAGSYVGTSSHTNNTPAPPKRYLAYVAAFSKMHTIQQVYDFLCQRLRIRNEDMRLWDLKDENNPVLLEEENHTLEHLSIQDNQQVLIEVRNKDMSWPEEMSSLALKNKTDKKKNQVPTDKGATGLSNLGNTCFMNSALQCISNTKPLTKYFNDNMHQYEFNKTNPLGMKGHIAKRYGDLVQDLWSGTSKSIAPLKLRWTIGKYAPRFNGFQQHDSQELLAFLLDGLHEDLNRVQNKPYVELKDSDGRPDEEVADEAWENHMLRNRSVIVDLFHGQLRSLVCCKECGNESVRFDPFTYLSLPLPLDNSMHLEIVVIRLDGTVPMKYGLRLNMEDKYKDLKQYLSELCDLTPQQLLLVEVFGAMIRSLPSDGQKVRTALGGYLYAYEIPPPPQLTMSTHPKIISSETTVLSNSSQKPHVEPLTPVNGLTPPEINAEDLNYAAKTSSLHRTQKVNGGIVTTGSTDTKVPNTTSSSSNGGLHTTPYLGNAFDGFVIAMHRKMMRMDVYFLSSQKTRPSLFGTPLILPCTVATRQSDLYKAVWTQVSRLVSPLPPSENGASAKNHAQDCDDSLGYEYPFVLKAVQRDGITCAWCPWYRFCRGCKIDCVDDDFAVGSAYIAIDWDPTALHLRYQSSQERVVADHDSVEVSRKLQTEPIDLDTCLKAFTKEEELGEDELWFCSKCKEHRQATKKLALWRLPPILIIQMKRFQYVNGRWVKSQKIVKFPKRKFDPSRFIAKNAPTDLTIPSCKNTPIMKQPVPNGIAVQTVDDELSESNKVNSETNTSSLSAVKIDNTKGSAENVKNKLCKDSPKTKRIRKNSISPLPTRKHNSVSPLPPKKSSRDSLEVVNGRGSTASNISQQSNGSSTLSTNSLNSEKTDNTSDSKTLSPTASHPLDSSLLPVAAGNTDIEDLSKPIYNLYSLSCHTGILGGGHYVAYAINPNDNWYIYNDSTCKEIKEELIDTDNAYMLFYERQGLNYSDFLPDVSDKEPDTSSIDDEFESDFKKVCNIQ